MKTMNPWLMIRWALVAAVYVATLAIAFDLVVEKNAKIAALEKEAAKESEAMRSRSRQQGSDREQALRNQDDSFQLKITGLEGQIMIMKEEVKSANSRVENARKLGYSQALLDRLTGKNP